MMERNSLEEKSGRHYKYCRFFFFCLYALLLVQLAAVVVNLVWIGLSPESVQVQDTGASYRYNGLVGYNNEKADDLPAYSPMRSEALFAFTTSALALLTHTVPLLLFMEFGRRMLKIVGKAHSPFLPEAACWLGRMGWTMVFLGLLGKLVYQCGIGVVVYQKIHYNNPFQLTYLLMGCFLLLLRDIFRRGCLLQQQADETL